MSNIEWTDETWNPTVGCTKVSPGCKNCYAETMHARLTAMGQPKYSEPFGVVKPWPAHLDAPLHWRKPRRVFVNSMSDLFHEGVPDSFIAEVWKRMALVQDHTFQILTKRSRRMRDYCSEMDVIHVAGRAVPNIWLGVSVEDQQRADERIPHLLETPAAVRFLSCEPLLGAADLGGYTHCDLCGYTHQIDWVIAGAESGKGARPMDLDWARSLRDQCMEACVPFFVKQLCHNGRKIPFGEWPEDLKVREFPDVR